MPIVFAESYKFLVHIFVDSLVQIRYSRLLSLEPLIEQHPGEDEVNKESIQCREKHQNSVRTAEERGLRVSAEGVAKGVYGLVKWLWSSS